MLHHLGVALLVFQGDGLSLLLLVAHESERNLIARTLLGKYLLKLCHASHLLSVNSHYHVALLHSGIGSGSIVGHFVDVHTFHGAEVHFLAFFLLHVNKVLHVATLNADDGTLNGAILLKVGHHLIHNGCRDGETISGI